MKHLSKSLVMTPLVLTSVFLSLSAHAGPYDDAVEAYYAENYVYAAQLYQIAAQQGNIDAQNRLAYMYLNGQGVEKSATQAVYWYRKSASQGNVEGQLDMGLMYIRGTGVPKSDVQAVYWYKKAANQGDMGAQFLLANMYHDGRGVAYSDAQAKHWYNKAATQGHEGARSALNALKAPPKVTKKVQKHKPHPRDYPKARCQRSYAAIFRALNARPKREVSDKDLSWALQWEISERKGATSCPALPSDYANAGQDIDMKAFNARYAYDKKMQERENRKAERAAARNMAPAFSVVRGQFPHTMCDWAKKEITGYWGQKKFGPKYQSWASGSYYPTCSTIPAWFYSDANLKTFNDALYGRNSAPKSRTFSEGLQDINKELSKVNQGKCIYDTISRKYICP